MNLITLNTELLKEKNFFYLCKKHISLLLCCFCFISVVNSQNNTAYSYVASNSKVVGLKKGFTKTILHKKSKVFIKENVPFYGLNQLTNTELIVFKSTRKYFRASSKQFVVGKAKAKIKEKLLKNHICFSPIGKNSYQYNFWYNKLVIASLHQKNNKRKKTYTALKVKKNTAVLALLKAHIKNSNTKPFFNSSLVRNLYCLVTTYSRPPPNPKKYAITAIA